MLAYLQIPDPALRKQIVRLAEKHAGFPQPLLVPDLAQDNVAPQNVSGEDDGAKRDPSG